MSPGETEERVCFDVPGRLNVFFNTFGEDLIPHEARDFAWIGFGLGLPGEMYCFDVLGRLNVLFKTFGGFLSMDFS